MNYLNQTTKCPKCRGCGYIPVEIETDETRKIYGVGVKITYAEKCSYCNGGHETRVNERKTRANIPSAFYNSKIKDFNWEIYQDERGNKTDLTKQKEIVNAFIDKFDVWEKKGIGLYIYSAMKGSGKTYLASCICNELIDRYPMNTKFVSVSNLIDIQKNAAESGQYYDKNPIELLCNCKLLVLDDLGQKTVGENWTSDILFQILDHRMTNKLITIITSNIKIAELKLDERLTDRINMICTQLPLPEICVRSGKATDNKRELFKELGIVS